jgi:hypothetical protein
MRMHLVQLLLPTHDNSGRRFAPLKFARIKALLTRMFGGITVYTRSPAEGLSTGTRRVVRDEIVIFEVMTARLDKRWWKAYRSELEREFRQDRIVVRASSIAVL